MSATGPRSFIVAAALIAALIGPPAFAADDEIPISQEGAIAGGVTPGDAPGFPVTLSTPGRYRLMANLTPTPGADGIVIDADNVTLDFHGHTLDGGGSGGSGVASGRDSIEIRDGVITGFQYFAIDSRASGKFWAISGMRVVANGLGVTAGAYARVVGNTIAANNNYGLSCEYCLVEGNVVAMNHDDGIDVKAGAVLGNMIAHNRGYGISAYMLAYVLSGYGNNTLINNNGSGRLGPDGRFIAQTPQVNGRIEALQPNVE
jgi:hypothetical protein